MYIQNKHKGLIIKSSSAQNQNKNKLVARSFGYNFCSAFIILQNIEF